MSQPDQTLPPSSLSNRVNRSLSCSLLTSVQILSVLIHLCCLARHKTSFILFFSTVYPECNGHTTLNPGVAYCGMQHSMSCQTITVQLDLPPVCLPQGRTEKQSVANENVGVLSVHFLHCSNRRQKLWNKRNNRGAGWTQTLWLAWHIAMRLFWVSSFLFCTYDIVLVYLVSTGSDEVNEKKSLLLLSFQWRRAQSSHYNQYYQEKEQTAEKHSSTVRCVTVSPGALIKTRQQAAISGPVLHHSTVRCCGFVRQVLLNKLAPCY